MRRQLSPRHLSYAPADGMSNLWRFYRKRKLDILFTLFLDVIIGLCKYLIEVMMFKNKIPDLSQKKDLMNAFQLGKALSVSPTTASRLWNGDFGKIGIDTLHRLCDLFDCQISDYLYYDGDSLPGKT